MRPKTYWRKNPHLDLCRNWEAGWACWDGRCEPCIAEQAGRRWGVGDREREEDAAFLLWQPPVSTPHFFKKWLLGLPFSHIWSPLKWKLSPISSIQNCDRHHRVRRWSYVWLCCYAKYMVFVKDDKREGEIPYGMRLKSITIFWKTHQIVDLCFINNPWLWDTSNIIYNSENKTQRLISCSYYLNIKQEFLAPFPS